MENFKDRVNSIVKKNFDLSCDIYHSFEEKYHFFYNLTIALCEFTNIKKDSFVLDAGCGCGYSMKAIYERYTKNIYGIDISEGMINLGRKLYPNFKFFVSDIAEVNNLFKENFFDYTILNLVVFILPDIENVFSNLFKVMKKGGKLSFSYYPDVVDENGNDILNIGFERAGYKHPRSRVITTYDQCINSLKKVGFNNIIESNYEIDFSLEFIINFFSIPAQSASLFPKENYRIRKEKIKNLFLHLKEFEGKGKIVWKLACASKK